MEKAITFAILALAASLMTLCVAVPAQRRSPTSPRFPMIERSLISALHSMRPELFNGTPLDKVMSEFPRPMEYPTHLYIDYYYVEYRQLLTQAIKLTKDSNLPEIDWTERYDFCVWIWCFDFTLSLNSKGSKLIGTEGTTSVNEVTPTKFKNTFNVPTFKWSSPEWLFTYSESGGKILYQGYEFSMENFTIVTEADYAYDETAGIIVSTLDVDLTVGNITTKLDLATWIDATGEIIEQEGPWIYDYTESTISDWDYAKKAYLKNLLTRINCLLTQQRAFPEKCVPSSDEKYNEYYDFLIIQLFQTVGLGSLLG